MNGIRGTVEGVGLRGWHFCFIFCSRRIFFLRVLNVWTQPSKLVGESELPALHIGLARRFYRRLNKRQRGTCDVDNKQAETAIRNLTGGSSTFIPLKTRSSRIRDINSKRDSRNRNEKKEIKDTILRNREGSLTTIRISRKNKKKGTNFERSWKIASIVLIVPLRVNAKNILRRVSVQLQRVWCNQRERETGAHQSIPLNGALIFISRSSAETSL